MKRALALTGLGFGAGALAIGIAWGWLAVTEAKLYGNLYLGE